MFVKEIDKTIKTNNKANNLLYTVVLILFLEEEKVIMLCHQVWWECKGITIQLLWCNTFLVISLALSLAMVRKIDLVEETEEIEKIEIITACIELY